MKKKNKRVKNYRTKETTPYKYIASKYDEKMKEKKLQKNMKL